jgi:phosphoglycerol transferase MdoB-like AlkP superfamily enzyme
VLVAIPQHGPWCHLRDGFSTMLQRKQTLFLLAAALLCGFSFLLPIATYRSAAVGGPTYELMTSRVFDPANGVTIEDAPLKYPIYIVYALVGAALLVDIFLFKNRKRQLLILRSAYIFGALLLVLQLVTHQSTSAYLSTGRHLERAFGPTMFFPIGILSFMFLAERGIRKDEELVKSMDRLR